MDYKVLEKDSIIGIILKDKLDYTGEEIEPLWAFKLFGVQKDSIIGFCGGIEVSIRNMKDLKDIKEENKYGNILIKSDYAINFIVEHFDNPDLKLIYHRQRILIFIVKNILEELSGEKLIKKGDDLYYGKNKLSVSIASRGASSSKIHLGINITKEGTPEYLNISSLSDLNLVGKEYHIIERTISEYISEIDKIERDIRKTLCL